MKKSVFLFSSVASIFLLMAFTTATQAPQEKETITLTDTVETTSDVFKPLDECKDMNLQKALIRTLNENPIYRKMIRNKRLSLSLVDLRDFDNAKLAQVNGSEMMYAASLPKIAVLFAAMDAIEKGELIETAEVKKDMNLMIAKSNNQASTRMIDRVGYKKIAAVLTHPQYKLYDVAKGGGLWVGKRYAAGGKRNPDPMKGLSHAATTEQVARFYYMMANGKLVSEQRSAQMMDIMTNPKLHHKFVNTLDKIAPDAKLYRKSGSWANFHSDSVMVWGDPSQRYILVALVESPNGEKIIRNLVYSAEKALTLASKYPIIAQN